MPIDLYIVEDHPILQQVLCEFFSTLPDVCVCGSATTAYEALAQLPISKAKFALVDVFLPDMSGIQLILQLQDRQPGLRCVMYSAYGGATYVRQALAAGACGYILKSDARQLKVAFHQVIDGKIYLSPELQQLVK